MLTVEPPQSAPEAEQLVATALRFAHEGQGDLALTIAERAVGLFTGSEQCWLTLAQMRRDAQQWTEADSAYAQALHVNPTRIEAWLARGVIASQRNQGARARNFLHRAIALLDAAPPDQNARLLFQALHTLGIVALHQGDDEQAIASLRRALVVEPTSLTCGFDLAHAWISAGFCAEADLLNDPPFTALIPPALHLGLRARAALSAGQLDDAEPMLDALMALAPDETWPYAAQAALMMLRMQPERAEPLLCDALRLQPNDPTLIHDYAIALSRLYRYAEAEALMTRLIDQAGPHLRTLCNRAVQRASMGLLSAAQDDLQQARSISASSNEAALELCRTEASLLPYMDETSGADLRRAMTALSRHVPREDHPRRAIADQPDRKLRIGLLSNTLRRHPVGWLTLAGIEQLDRNAFDVICFGRFEPTDAIAQRYAARAQDWHAIEGLSDRDVATYIADRAIDILIDMGGFGDAGRIAVAAYRPAPVQIKWVGMQCATTGMPEIDWMISDRWETPLGFEPFYTERLLRLPDGYVCYTPPDYAQTPSALPARAAGHVTFGCFNNVTKLSDRTLDLWRQILTRLPTARLALRCPQFSQQPITDAFLRRWATLGIDPARLTILGRTAHPAFLAGYQKIDIALDPVPYSGGLTTCEALYMGVPVVTLAGEFFAARHSVSHLSNVGLEEWATATAEAYIERAVAAATDLTALSALRAGLRAQMLASPLCDAPRFGRNFGHALRQAWHSACTEAAPQKSRSA